MSTRSYIGVADRFFEDGTFDHCKIVYCHHDGYPEWNGRILLDCYNSSEKVNELIDKGGMSSLYKTIEECDFYGNEGELPVVFRYKEFVKWIETSDIEWIYLYDLEKERWMYVKTKWVKNVSKHFFKTLVGRFEPLSDYFKNIRCCVGIAEEIPDEKTVKNCKFVYVNENGDPKDVGNILLEYYNSEELIEDLLSRGGMTNLGNSIETSSFYRKNNKRSKPVECANRDELLDWCNSFFRKDHYYFYDYIYLYDQHDSKWKCIQTSYEDGKRFAYFCRRFD